MARLTDTILEEKAFARGSTQSMIDLSYGGQNGWAPETAEWLSNQAYVRKNVIAILLEAPRFFQLMPDPQKWVQTLKSLVELHPRTIEGLNAGVKWDFEEHAFGGAGEMQQDIIDAKRDRTEPVFGYVEKYGKPIQTFYENWGLYGMMDPDTKTALIGTLDPFFVPDDALADWYTMTCLFIEPDPYHRKVVRSWLTTNMAPKGTGEIIGKRDKTAPGEILNLSIEFTGITQSNLGTNVFAQAILDSINITNANPYLRPAFVQGYSADVAAAGVGYSTMADNLGATAVTGISNT